MTSFRLNREAVQGGDTSRLDSVLLRFVDMGLAVCIFAVPMLMGGRHALGQLVLIATAFAVALAWMLRQCLGRESHWRGSPAEWLLLAGLGLLVLQVIPMSESLLAKLAPGTVSILPLWASQADPSAALGAWSTVSLTPAATRTAIPLFLAYGLLILVTVQRIEHIEHVERLLRWIAMSALAVATFGLVQWATSNGRYFWFYEHPFSSATDSVKANFTNRNHFAQFLALGLGPLIAWIADLRTNRVKPAPGMAWRATTSPGISPLRLMGLGIVAFGALMSLSRGGAVACFVAAAVSIAVSYRVKALGIRFVLGLAAVAVLTAAALWIHGYDQVTGRLSDLTSGSLETLDNHRGRRAIWAADLQASRDFWLLGAGVGSHAEIYPMYLDLPLDREYTHAENGPIQTLLETGATGLGLVCVAVGLCAIWCFGALRAASARQAVTADQRDAALAKRVLLCAGAISAALAANMAHTMVDFIWYVPACTMIVGILAGCAFRVRQLAAAASGRRNGLMILPRPIAAAMALALAAGGSWAVAGQFALTMAQIHWDRYLVLDLAEARASHPDANRPSQSPASVNELPTVESTARRLDELKQVVDWDPCHARAQLRLAGTYLQHFSLVQQTSQNAMPLSQIGDAAMAVGFPSRAALDEWLSRAIGDGYHDLTRAWTHARQAVALAPTQGEGYLHLAQLCFLGGPRAADAKKAYLAQALKVRPFDGAVLFEIGKEASLAGDVPRALECWRKSFQVSNSYRKQLIELLAGRVPVEFFLEGLQPNLEALRVLQSRYTALTAPAQAPTLLAMYQQNAITEHRTPEEEAAAATAWLQGQLNQLRRFHLQAARAEVARLQQQPAAAIWFEIAAIEQQAGDSAAALASLEKAFQADPSNFRVRYTLATYLAAAGRFTDAETHLNWCARVRPNDQAIQNLLRDTAKKRIADEDRTLGKSPKSQTIR